MLGRTFPFLAVFACLLLAGFLALSTTRTEAEEGGTRPTTSQAEGRLKGRVVFLLDLSGSMRIPDQANPSAKPLPPVPRLAAAVQEVSDTLLSLSERGDYEFDIVFFSRTVTVLSKTLRGDPGLTPLTTASRKEAAAFLARARSSGTTRLFPALEIAFSLFPEEPEPGILNTIFLYTDGVPTFGEDDASDPGRFSDFLDRFRLRVRYANKRNVRINTFAVGATSISREFLRSLASDNGGVSIVGKTVAVPGK